LTVDSERSEQICGLGERCPAPQEAPGSVREFDFAERIAADDGDLHLSGPIRGHARLMRTDEGVLVHADHVAPVALECSRCLDEVRLQVRGTLDEEFLPSVDLRTGVPVAISDEDQPRIDEHHEIDLDEVLRQNILTNLPLQPLCEAACPGLCPECGERLDSSHRAHSDEAPIDPASPFAQLATLLKNEEDT
jgi:uncharacterized protein